MYSLSHRKWAPGTGVAFVKRGRLSIAGYYWERFKSEDTSLDERFPRTVLYGDWGAEKADSYCRAYNSARRRLTGTRRGNLEG